METILVLEAMIIAGVVGAGALILRVISDAL